MSDVAGEAVPDHLQAQDREQSRQGRARAYCGPAHGRTWPAVEDEGAPAPIAMVAAGGQVLRYRLVVDPRTRRPARDHLGNYLYMFLPHIPDRTARDGTATGSAWVAITRVVHPPRQQDAPEEQVPRRIPR